MTIETLVHRMAPLRESGRFEPQLLEAFQRFVAEAPDEALFRVNPLGWAREHKVVGRDAIDLFVHATRSGIFDFNWGLICPACGGFIFTPGGLKNLSAERDCKMCGVRAGETLDDGVEVSFTVNEAVRRTRFHGGWTAMAARSDNKAALMEDGLRMYFSSAQPMDGVLLDFFRAGTAAIGVVANDRETVLEHDFSAQRRGAWRLLVPMVHAVAQIRIEPGGASEVAVQIDDGACLPGELVLRPGPVTLRLTQRTGERELVYSLVCFDYEAMGDGPPPLALDAGQFLTGKQLLSTQSFRDLFRAETLPPDGSLEIRALAMLFTDLKASTQLYERVGDLKALALVRQHFKLLRDVVAKHQGAVVKTIGDAVMATFSSPVDAAAAAVEMHQVIEDVPELQIKVGVHVGPCVAVDSNERLDYFGQTVNIAARVQALAEGREVVITDGLLQSPGVAEVLAKLPLARESAHLKGIDAPVVVHRATVA